MSRGVAFAHAIRLASRSRSGSPRSASRNEARGAPGSSHAATASWRARMAASDASGRSSQARNRRAPGAVIARFTCCQSVWAGSPPGIGANSSRCRAVAAS